jgi:hypothetical protein
MWTVFIPLLLYCKCVLNPPSLWHTHLLNPRSLWHTHLLNPHYTGGLGGRWICTGRGAAPGRRMWWTECSDGYIDNVYCVLYTVYCVLCTVYCVLCTVYYGLCTMYCVLCTVYCVLCAVYCVLCIVYCVLCTVCCVLCTVYWDSTYYVLCTMFYMYFILCIRRDGQNAQTGTLLWSI